MSTFTTNPLKAWSRGVTSPGEEFALTPCEVLFGSIPEQLRGTLYRNGPGCLQRGNAKVGHWFDGDGAILAVHFTEAGGNAVYRYVQTSGYQQEKAANRYILPNYGMTAPGAFWQNWGKSAKNSANTSVLAKGDRLLALWEGGYPHALDLKTLETQGIETLSLAPSEPFSAHPKIAPDTGEIYNFGIGIGKDAILNLYRCDATAQVVYKRAFNLKGFPLIHDFVLAGRYLVFFIPPVRLNLLSVALGLSSYSQGMRWQPELGTEILVFDRSDFSLVSRFQTEAWYQWHFANGFEASDGSVVVAFMRFPDFQTNQHLQEVATGKTQTLAAATFRQIRFEPSLGKILENEDLYNFPCEFPVVPLHQVGQKWDRTFFATHCQGVDFSQELFGAIGCFDHQTGNVSIASPGINCYASEPIYVPYSPSEGWILTVVYNGNSHTSDLLIYQSLRLSDAPICGLRLPGVIPLGFHGCWYSA